MKKIVSALLCVVILMSFAACQSGEKGRDKTPSQITLSDTASTVSESLNEKGSGDEKTSSNPQSDSNDKTDKTNSVVRPNRNESTSSKADSQDKEEITSSSTSSKQPVDLTPDPPSDPLGTADHKGFIGYDGGIFISNDYKCYKIGKKLWPDAAYEYNGIALGEIEMTQFTLKFPSELGLSAGSFAMNARYAVSSKGVHMYAEWWKDKTLPIPKFVSIPGNKDNVIIEIDGKVFIYSITSGKFTKLHSDNGTYSVDTAAKVSENGNYVAVNSDKKYVYIISSGKLVQIPDIDYDKNTYSKVNIIPLYFFGSKLELRLDYIGKNGKGTHTEWAVFYSETGEIAEMGQLDDLTQYTQHDDKPYLFTKKDKTGFYMCNLKTQTRYVYEYPGNEVIDRAFIGSERYIYVTYLKNNSSYLGLLDLKNREFVKVQNVHMRTFGHVDSSRKFYFKQKEVVYNMWVSDTAMIIVTTDGEKYYHRVLDMFKLE